MLTRPGGSASGLMTRTLVASSARELCEHVFLTAQPHPRVKFARAISTRNVFLAELALGELENVLLEDALQLVRLYGEQDDPKYAAACRRYLARWIVEESPSLEDVAATACHFVERGRPRLV